jgi:oxygen-independent coproporphyrinogen-3 oxidase
LLNANGADKEPNSLEHALTIWDAIGDSNNQWERRNPPAAYFHVPFCDHRCGYCNFAVITQREDLMDAYIAALRMELSCLQQRRPVESIFVGGGTPTSLSDQSLVRLLESIHQWFIFDDTVEWTFEANPNNVTPELCWRLKDSGVNRLSIGVQSFDDSKLRHLDRNHSADAARRAIDTALSYFGNVSLDLIFAAPFESQDGWSGDLQAAIQSGVQHISTYGLTIEKGTRFWSFQQKSQLIKPDELIELAMYEMAIDSLSKAGYEHYEVSNFAKPGLQSRHNLAYWQLAGWWAFGCSASRSLGRTRSTNHSSVVNYIRQLERNLLPLSDIQTLTHWDWTIDAFVFGMRTRRGVDIEYLTTIGDPQAISMITEKSRDLLREGMMYRNQSHLELTHRGLLVSDSLWPKFYSASPLAT